MGTNVVSSVDLEGSGSVGVGRYNNIVGYDESQEVGGSFWCSVESFRDASVHNTVGQNIIICTHSNFLSTNTIFVKGFLGELDCAT